MREKYTVYHISGCSYSSKTQYLSKRMQGSKPFS